MGLTQDGNRVPGQVTACVLCGAVSEFDEDLTLKLVTAETLEKTDLLALSQMNSAVRQVQELAKNLPDEVVAEFEEIEEILLQGDAWEANDDADILLFRLLSDIPIAVFETEDGAIRVVAAEFLPEDKNTYKSD